MKENFKPIFGATAMLIAFGVLGYALYIKAPIGYDMRICKDKSCVTYKCANVRADGIKITIYKNRHNNQVKQVLILNRDQNAYITPIYR